MSTQKPIATTLGLFEFYTKVRSKNPNRMFINIPIDIGRAIQKDCPNHNVLHIIIKPLFFENPTRHQIDRFDEEQRCSMWNQPIPESGKEIEAPAKDMIKERLRRRRRKGHRMAGFFYEEKEIQYLAIHHPPAMTF
jgi:hypothetical protein